MKAPEKLIGIEGVPGAGKTMSLLKLAQSFPQQLIVLPELNFDPTSALVEDERTDQWRIYHSLWRIRLDIIRAFPETVSPFLFDRTYYSNIAYTYALSVLTKDKREYEIQKQMIYHDFADSGINSLLILDIDPLTGLERRLRRGDLIPKPWDQTEFLKALQVFYRQILPDLHPGQITYIDVDSLSLEKTVKHLIIEVSWLMQADLRNDLSSFGNKEVADKVAGVTQDLGYPLAGPILVLGCQTYYFRQHAVQVIEDRAVFLNNDRLEVLCGFEWMKIYQRTGHKSGNPSFKKQIISGSI